MSVFSQKSPLSMRPLPKMRDALRRGRARLPSFAAVVMAAALLLTAVFVGLVVALGVPQFTIVLAGVLIFVPVLLFVNTANLMPIMFVAVFFVSGMAQYFFNMRLATWMASGLSALFFVRAVLEVMLTPRRSPQDLGSPRQAVIVLLCASMYLLFYFFSLALGHATLAQTVSVLRFCLPMFGVLFAMYWFKWQPRRLHLLWLLIVWITLAQLPVTLYQHFFKMNALGWDGVVGSFGGNMSPVLVLFSVAAMLYLLARWSRGLTPLWQVVLVFIVGIAVVLLGEVKAVFVWLPIGVFWVLRRKVLRNFAAFIVFSALMMAFLAGTFAVYHALYWGQHTKTDTMEEKLNSLGGYVVDPNGINYVTGEISRGASLALWYRDPVPSAQERLIGYGPGASLTSQSTGRGVVAARYRRLDIGATGMASLLWDVGILGALLFVSIFGSGFLLGWRYVKNSGAQADGAALAMVDTATAMMLLAMSTLIYNKTLIDEPTAQLLAYFCLGCIVQCARYLPVPRSAAPVPGAGGRAGVGGRMKIAL